MLGAETKKAEDSDAKLIHLRETFAAEAKKLEESAKDEMLGTPPEKFFRKTKFLPTFLVEILEFHLV